MVEEQSALLRVAMLVARDTPLEQLFAPSRPRSRRAGRRRQRRDALHRRRAGGRGRRVGGRASAAAGQRRAGLPPRESALGRAQTTRPAGAGRPLRRRARRGCRRDEARSGCARRSPARCFADGEAWGALVATAPDEEALPPGCEQRLVALAEMVGQALANDRARAELAASRSRLLEAGDETRRRLERALHEGAHQHVVALALKLRVASGARPGAPEAEVLRDVLADAMEASAELSELARGLHPGGALRARARRRAAGARARAELPVMLRALPGRRFSAVIETTAYLMVAEALANAAAHAHATECTLRADDRGDRLASRCATTASAAPSCERRRRAGVHRRPRGRARRAASRSSPRAAAGPPSGSRSRSSVTTGGTRSATGSATATWTRTRTSTTSPSTSSSRARASPTCAGCSRRSTRWAAPAASG